MRPTHFVHLVHSVHLAHLVHLVRFVTQVLSVRVKKSGNVVLSSDGKVASGAGAWPAGARSSFNDLEGLSSEGADLLEQYGGVGHISTYLHMDTYLHIDACDPHSWRVCSSSMEVWKPPPSPSAQV